QEEKRGDFTLTDFFRNPYSYDASSPILQDVVNAEGDTALYIAAKAGHMEAVKALLKSPHTKLNWQNHKGITAMSVAAHKGQADIVKELIRVGADVNIESNNGSTPLIQASHFGHSEVVGLLLEANAQVDRPNNKGTTALMRATQEGNEEVVSLLTKAGADVSRRNNERMNALMLGCQRGHASCVKLLIQHNAEIDGQTGQGSTALMLACKRGHLEVVKVLLNAGAEIYMKDTRGRTAQDTAQRRHRQKILALLKPNQQMRMMQDAERHTRAALLNRLYRVHALAAAEPAISDQPQQPIPLLLRSLQLTQPLFERIVEYLPLPRLWEATLGQLRRRCHIDASEAIRGSLQLMDEIFTDLLLLPDQSDGHLVRIAHETSLCNELRAKYNMPDLLLQWVKQWSDIQSMQARLDMGVQFMPRVAVQVVLLATEVWQWYRSQEIGKEYVIDP
ncbi:unnamed protein product, partial [Chrysoparadoxa australica]